MRPAPPRAAGTLKLGPCAGYWRVLDLPTAHKDRATPQPQEQRVGKAPGMATTVTLSLPDGVGGFASINITDIVTNKATASYKCAPQRGIWQRCGDGRPACSNAADCQRASSSLVRRVIMRGPVPCDLG